MNRERVQVRVCDRLCATTAMLQELHIQNYAVIESLSLEFGPGLNILSGETGSGKSILVDALGLALGGRASPDLIRTGRDRATVTAIFRTDHEPPWSGWLEDYGIAASGDGEVILRREVQSGGRSRLLVNDQPVTVAAAKALAPLLLEVHGQSEHVALLGRVARLMMLDQFTGADDLLEQVATLHARCRELQREMESLSQNEQDRLRTIDLLRFQAQELGNSQLEPGEDSRLEDEKRVLANLERIRAAAATAFAELYDEEGAACSRLAAVERAYEDLVRYDSSAAQYIESLAGARAALDDLAYFLRDYVGKLHADPKRLGEIEDRLAQIDRLKRKYGKSIEEILAYRGEIDQQLARLEHADERREKVGEELERSAKDYSRVARKLSEKRRAAARGLEKLVRGELSEVGMEKARFQVRFDDLTRGSSGPVEAAAAGGSTGLDEIEYHISPNPGEDMRPLEKTASGGELSRLMLALKTVVGSKRATGSARNQRVPPTFIFDEIDAGIGGRIAEAVGRRLKRLARDTQVLCVTHQAQIACFADHHFYVEKLERAGRTVTTVQHLGGEQNRAAELARMLSGARVTDAALKHATTMLKQSQSA